MAELSYEQRKRLRRLAEDARDACNRHYGPFVDAVAHPLNVLALLDMAALAAQSPNQDAELCLRRIVRRHRQGLELVHPDEWAAIEAIALRSTSPLRSVGESGPELELPKK